MRRKDIELEITELSGFDGHERLMENNKKTKGILEEYLDVDPD